VLEDRLALWERVKRRRCSRGMSAISTVLWTHVRPGDVVLMSQPLYGGTELHREKPCPLRGERGELHSGHDRNAVTERGGARTKGPRDRRPSVFIIVETPANPTNSLVDLELMREVSLQIGGGRAATTPVRSTTVLGAGIFQRPLGFGADL